MASKNVTLSEQIRNAIKDSGMTCYRIGKLTDIDKGAMSRFMADKSGLSIEALDRLGELLEFRLTAGVTAANKKEDR